MKKAVSIFVIGLFIIGGLGVNALYNEKMNNLKFMGGEKKTTEGNMYTHTVLVGVATSQNCAPCDYMNTFMYSLHNNETHDFHYVDMIVFDYEGNILNSWANYWVKRYNIYKQPSLVFDGAYKKHTGYQSLDDITNNIEECGNRNVWDITADMTVFWLGDATIKIDIYIQNNEDKEYSFYLRTFVTEKYSRYQTYFKHSYHYGFLDFAIFGDSITIPPESSYYISEIWNGNEHKDGHGNDFGNIKKNNIKVITGIYRGNTPSHYIDQTLAAAPISGDMPDKPRKPSGPSRGSPGIDYTFTTYSFDPQGEKIYYWFVWGDGSNTGWLGPFNSGKTVHANHSWINTGSFNIKVKAKDTEGHESVWSDQVSVKIPRNRSVYNSIFFQLLEQFPILQKLLNFFKKGDT